MATSIGSTALRFPEWLFEQDYLVFLSFFGWMLVGLLSWGRPLCDSQKRESLWFWFGYFAFFEAMADFVRALSFSDAFFRTFSLDSPLEMLGLGCLVELSLRHSDRYRGKRFPPYAAVACALLGFAIEVSSMLYSLIVAFLVSTVACLWFATTLGKIAKERGRIELYVVIAGILLLIPAWLLQPGHVAFLRNAPLMNFEEFPFYGFALLFLRIASAWLILGGFWRYRLQARVEDVGAHAQERLRFWGYRVLPGSLAAIALAAYMVTTWKGRSEGERIEAGYLSRAQTAALSIDRSTLADAWSGGVARRSQAREELGRSLSSIYGIGDRLERVYLWRKTENGFESIVNKQGRPIDQGLDGAQSLLLESADGVGGIPFALGPVKLGSGLFLKTSVPVRDLSGDELVGWLSFDIQASEWLRNISLARLQAIVIAGLLLALLIFFLYYQIENESEADLALAKERAEAGDRAKSEFLAVISHEIRTPLQSVLGYSNLLRGTRLDEKQMACLDTIQAEGKILLRIVQDILDFSNLRKANSELKEGPVELRRLVEETYRTIRPMAEKKDLTAELEIGENLPALVRTDGVRLRQVLLNLVGNSVKYTDSGTIRFAARSLGGGALEFTIADTGVGIKDSDLERLFEPFIQLEHMGTSPREGAGLGLAIVSRIVELMGGSISVESALGKGSEFTARFDFEVLEKEVDSTEEDEKGVRVSIEDSDELAKLYPLKTLVVDDNPMVRRLIVQYLESLGYEPDELEDGKPASEKGAAYDLIVTDLRMPVMDGPTAVTIIREKSGLQDQPWIVGVSATLAESEIERALESGVNDFMGKPFFAPDLEERIRRIPWLDRLAGVGEDSDGKAAESKVEESEKIDPETAFASRGMGVFSEEMIADAIKEVKTLCDEMIVALGREDWAFVRDTAHYISNTAMAIGIEPLYVDSKALQAAAEQESGDCRTLLERLQDRFEDWKRSSASR